MSSAVAEKSPGPPVFPRPGFSGSLAIDDILCHVFVHSICGVKTLSFPFRAVSFIFLQIPHPSSLLNLFSFPPLFLFLQILMAETSALCFSPFSSLPSNIYRSREPNSYLSFASPSKSSASHSRSSRSIRFTCKASDSGNFLGDESLGFFPWSDGDNGIHVFCSSSYCFIILKKVT